MPYHGSMITILLTIWLMMISTIIILCCTFDKEDLKLEKKVQTIHNDILIGSLTYIHCKSYYPIISELLVMTPDEYRDLEIEKGYYAYLMLEDSSRKIENFRLIEY